MFIHKCKRCGIIYFDKEDFNLLKNKHIKNRYMIHLCKKCNDKLFDKSLD